MRDSETETKANEDVKKDFGFNLLMPVALLLVLLVVPFSINTFMHYVAKSNQFNPLIMKIPIDHEGITIPETVKQYEGFEVSLNLDTQHLADLLNRIVSMAAEGTSIQGIAGEVSPNMRAEVVGEGFVVDNPGPQEQLYNYNNATSWTWYVMPESSGDHTLSIRLHLMTHGNGQQELKVVDLAQASFSVKASPLEWLKRHMIWIILIAAIPAAFVVYKRRYAHRGDD